MKEVFAEDTQPSQIIDVFIREVQILDIIYDLFQSGHDGISAFVRILPEEHVKDDSFVFLCLKIALHHSQLIEICEQGEILCAHSKFPLFILHGAPGCGAYLCFTAARNARGRLPRRFSLRL